jgi:hypothetical protein
VWEKFLFGSESERDGSSASEAWQFFLFGIKLLQEMDWALLFWPSL